MMSPPLFVVVRRVVRPGGDGGFDQPNFANAVNNDPNFYKVFSKFAGLVSAYDQMAINIRHRSVGLY